MVTRTKKAEGTEEKDKSKRARVKIFREISKYIIEAEKPFNKSALRDIGLNAQTAENYITCIEIAQSTPKIVVYRTGTRTSIGKESYPEMDQKTGIPVKSKRTMLKIFQDVSNFIKNATEPFHKSALKQIGLDTNTAEIYIKSFEIAQSTPLIDVRRFKKNTVVAKKKGL